MVQDGLKEVTSIEGLENIRKQLSNSSINNVIKDDISLIFPLLLKVDYNKVSLCYEDLIDEFYFIFYLKSDNDSGRISIVIRENFTSKIYAYGCKFFFKDFKNILKKEEQLYQIVDTVLKGDYNINEEKYNEEVLSYEVTLLTIKKKIEFGLFNKWFRRKREVKSYKGVCLYK